MYDRGNEAEVLKAADRLAEISRDIPLQIMRFIPFGNAPLRQEPTVTEAENLCGEVRSILPYTYLFNTPGTPYLHTRCPECGTLVIYGNRRPHGGRRPFVSPRCHMCLRP